MAVGKMVRQLHTTLDGGTWHGVASRGVEREREVVGFDGFDGCLAPVASMATMVLMVWLTSMTSKKAQEDADVKAPLLLRSLDAVIIGVTERMGVHVLATPRETTRSCSPRRVHKIRNDGERAEGLLFSRRDSRCRFRRLTDERCLAWHDGEMFGLAPSGWHRWRRWLRWWHTRGH